MSLIQNYSNNVSPPGPLIPITIVHPVNNSQTESTIAFVDSGADDTIIPRSIAQNLQLIPNDTKPISDFQGNFLENAPIYDLHIQFGNFDFRIDVVGMESEAIIGRNILNQLTTILNGRQQVLELSP